jgi:hypothetical protein
MNFKRWSGFSAIALAVLELVSVAIFWGLGYERSSYGVTNGHLTQPIEFQPIK